MGLFRIPRGTWLIVKEVARHLLRRPVVGIAAATRTKDGRWLLIRRADTGAWALPGGTLEWGESLRPAIAREIQEETGAAVVTLGRLLGVYSRPDRDPRFHAVTILVEAIVEPPTTPPMNPLEILDVQLFASDALPTPLSHGMDEMLSHALQGETFWE